MATDVKREVKSQRSRYRYAAAIGVANASLFIAAIIIRHGTEDASVWMWLAVFCAIWIFTFPMGLLFWSKGQRSWFRMSILSALAICACWFGLFGLVLIMSFQSLIEKEVSLFDFLKAAFSIFPMTYGLPFFGAIVVSWFFTRKPTDPAKSF